LGEAVLVVDQKQSPMSMVVALEAVWVMTRRWGVARGAVPMAAVREAALMAAVREAVNNYTTMK
jgi:hypothetical protein